MLKLRPVNGSLEAGVGSNWHRFFLSRPWGTYANGRNPRIQGAIGHIRGDGLPICAITPSQVRGDVSKSVSGLPEGTSNALHYKNTWGRVAWPSTPAQCGSPKVLLFHLRERLSDKLRMPVHDLRGHNVRPSYHQAQCAVQPESIYLSPPL
ncbi:hypothetical protein BD310DRAFT_46433 [Dichomitus squalens]|uniref:Uncharacterized protein n=1 Tax=Dichomitus squalens TaxID=114155 RepID=A0A4Q9QEM3_9APHY|nr:hypothetical protein BD310DRAFT_46433 [Dichomitus squalens]